MKFSQYFSGLLPMIAVIHARQCVVQPNTTLRACIHSLLEPLSGMLSGSADQCIRWTLWDAHLAINVVMWEPFRSSCCNSAPDVLGACRNLQDRWSATYVSSNDVELSTSVTLQKGRQHQGGSLINEDSITRFSYRTTFRSN